MIGETNELYRERNKTIRRGEMIPVKEVYKMFVIIFLMGLLLGVGVML